MCSTLQNVCEIVILKAVFCTPKVHVTRKSLSPKKKKHFLESMQSTLLLGPETGAKSGSIVSHSVESLNDLSVCSVQINALYNDFRVNWDVIIQDTSLNCLDFISQVCF